MSKSRPLVSVIIVNFNGLSWLKNCLSSLSKQDYLKLEVIVVDNNSTDSSVAYIRKNHPTYKVICNNSNFGFAKGNNIGVEHASGHYFFLLNNDTVLIENDLITKSIFFLLSNTKIGVLQPKICLLDNPNKIDLCGSFWTPTTMLYHYGCFQDEKMPIFDYNFPIFTCKGAAMFIRRECVEKVGLFDPDFWCYYEETDFCHRIWLSGYQCWYFSEAKLLHSNGGTSLSFQNDFIQYHNFKNKLRSFIKNFSGFERVFVVFKFTLTAILFSFLSLLKGKPKIVTAILASFWWNVKKLRHSKSPKIKRVISSIPDIVIKSPGFSYYIDLIKDLKKHKYVEEV